MPDGFVLVPKSIYLAPLEKTLLTLSGPPTRRTSTIRLRKAPGVALPEPLLHAQLSTEAGMPEVDSEAGLQRREDGTVEPKTETAALSTIKLKLQDTKIVEKFARFGERFPSRGR